MSFATWADAIRDTFRTRFLAAKSTWTEASQVAWPNTKFDPPAPDPSDVDGTSFISFEVRELTGPRVSSGRVFVDGVVIVQCFVPEGVGEDAVRDLAVIVAQQFEGSNKTMTAGSSVVVFEEPEEEPLGADGEGFYGINLRARFRFHEAA